MKKFLIVSVLFCSGLVVSGQTDSLYLVTLNQRIDDFVVNRDVQALDSLYAGDFVFSHGSGRVEGKQGWLKTVGRARYPSRQHDSVKVELHPQVAVVKGKMTIARQDKEKLAKYHLRYIRVYALREQRWQLISHSTTHEVHEN